MEKILIIDDSPLQATQLKDILSNEYEVSVAQTAEEGFKCVCNGGYSLILMDVVMPGMDGFTLLKKLQEEVIIQGVPVIMISSLNDVEHEVMSLTLGAVDYITKPFSPLIVKARVNTHIRLYNYRRQIEQQSRTDQLTGVANRRQYDYYSAKNGKKPSVFKFLFLSVCLILIALRRTMIHSDIRLEIE